jgi:hypothetical protein
MDHSPTSRAKNEPDECTMTLYKMEYEKCADRYENIYKAVWTNFSYIAVVSGAIMTFGSTRLDLNYVSLIACMPLLFWFWSSYTPLDFYGNSATARLSEIEGIINNTFNVEIGHYIGFEKARTANPPSGIRTKYVVRLVFLFIHILALLLTYNVYFKLWSVWWLFSAGACVSVIYSFLVYYSNYQTVSIKTIAVLIFGAFVLTMLVLWFGITVKAPEVKRESQSVDVNVTGFPATNQGLIPHPTP